MQNRGGHLLPADCGLALRWELRNMFFFCNRLKQIYGSRSFFFKKSWDLSRDSFTIDVHTDPSEIHESYHHLSQDTVFKAMQRRRFTYCTKSLQSKKCIPHGPTAESLIFGWSCVKKQPLKPIIFIHQRIQSCTFPTTEEKLDPTTPTDPTAIFHRAPRGG